MITTAQWNDLVKNAKVSWANTEPEFAEKRQEIAKIIPVSAMTSEHSSASRAQTARARGEGDTAFIGTHKQGYRINLEQREIAIIHEVSKMMLKFDRYDKISEMIRGGKIGTIRRMEMDVCAPLTYAWATSYTNLDGATASVAAPDGLALMSASHVPNSNPDSLTFANQLGTTHDAFSPTTLENLEALFDSFLDETDGRLTPVIPNAIIHASHAPTRHAVRRAIMSVQLAGTANNDKNTFTDYKIIELPYLAMNHTTEARDATKNRYVFLAKIDDLREGIRVEMSEEPNLDDPNKVYSTSGMELLSSAIFDMAVMRANWIAGTKGDGTSV